MRGGSSDERLLSSSLLHPLFPRFHRSTASPVLPVAAARLGPGTACPPQQSPDRRYTWQGCKMYIRVKRNKSTYFIQCDPTETVLNIKQKVHSIIDQAPSDQRLILLATNDILVDSKTLADQKVENDAIVALALRKDNNEFEAISIANPEDFMSSS